jgi:hypothetical protein
LKSGLNHPLYGIDAGQINLVQPPHFIAEVANEPEFYATAINLAARYQHHFFDTFYHAVALNTLGATLITADTAYSQKANGSGRILQLKDYTECNM